MQASTAIAAPASTSPDFAAIKTRQKATWASGDYAVIGTTLQIVGETLCEAADLRAGERVLDVAAGNGNATLAAARRWCEVTSTDYVPALLERARERAAAERLQLSTSSPTANGATRRWRSVDAFVQEVADARVWEGIHYRTSTEVGVAMGRRIGALAAARLARPAAGDVASTAN